MNRCPSFRNFILMIVSVALASSAWAGETGKLSGTVRDSTTREALIGANVVLLGTTLGAATDANGAYFVNNIPPGLYRVRVSMVGYGTIIYENVRINVDLTTELNSLLPSEVITLEKEIVVTARRPVVQKDQTSTRTVVEGSTIVNELRFQAVEQVLELQAGVTIGTDGALHVRGGRTGGTVYQVDGVPLLNPFTRTTAGEMEVQNVQELQAHLGTFDAEYGNAADGIVTVFTKDGGESYTGRVGYESARLNPSPYQKKDWNLDRDEVRSLPPDQQAIYLDHVRKPDGSSAYDYVSVLDDPYAEKYLLVPVLGTFSASVGGPVPVLSPLKFFASGRFRNEDSHLPYGYTLYRAFTGKLTYPVSSLLTLRGSYDWAQDYGQDYDHAYKYWRWWDSGLDTLGRRGSYPLSRFNSRRVLLSVRHVLSNSTFYDITGAWLQDNSSTAVPDRTLIYDPVTGEMIQSSYYTRLYVGGNDSNFQYGDVRYWTQTDNSQWLLKGSLESQVDVHHQLRSGFELNWYTTARHRIGMPPRPNLEFFEFQPVVGSFYLQDKIEYSFMILKLGLRLDYFDPRASEYPDVSNVLYTVTTPSGNVEYRAYEKQPVEPHLQISPRIGLAHPISDRTSIHFAYGHFFQVPRFYDLYRNDALDDILVNDALVGNPGITPEKTVTYEIGLQQQLALDWGLNVTAYSKDITNLTSTYYYFVGRDYTVFINSDFGRVQGIDLTLNKRLSSGYAMQLSYSLMYAQGNMSDPTEGYSSYREEDAALRPNRNFPLDFDQRHKVNLTLITKTPRDFGPSLGGFSPLELFTFTGIFTAGSGLPYTPTSRASEESNIVPEPNSARRPWVFNLDLKISRQIPINPLTATIYLDIENVFDAVNTRLIWSRTGEPWNEGPTSVRPKDRQANPENVYPPRIIRLGFFVEF